MLSEAELITLGFMTVSHMKRMLTTISCMRLLWSVILFHMENHKEQLDIFLMNLAFMLSVEVVLVLRKMATRFYLVSTILMKVWQAPMENGLICGKH